MDAYKDFSSFFILDYALFGSYPSQDQVQYLKKFGVTHFVDLTTSGGEVPGYNTGESLYINYPIQDRNIPQDLTSFTIFILKVHKVLSNLPKNDKMYIHCRGGHGRVGIIVAILLYLHHGNISTESSLELTNEYHNNRLVMRDKWRIIGSPQTRAQRTFVHRFFGDMIFYRAYRRGPASGFSNYSNHRVLITKDNPYLPLGDFPTGESLFQASKRKNDKSYVQRHIQSTNPKVSRKIGEKVETDPNWDANKYKIMEYIIGIKFRQHDDIRRNLLQTALKNITYNSRTDAYFGAGNNGSGQNNLGKILMNFRNKYYNEVAPCFEYKNMIQVQS